MMKSSSVLLFFAFAFAISIFFLLIFFCLMPESVFILLAIVYHVCLVYLSFSLFKSMWYWYVCLLLALMFAVQSEQRRKQ